MRGIASEALLTIGVLIAVGVSLLQLKGVFFGQQKMAKEEIVVAFAEDLRNIINEARSSTGNVSFVYYPSIRKYVVKIGENLVKIHDKISKKNATLVVSGANLQRNVFEDSKVIYITKFDNTIYIFGEELLFCPKERVCEGGEGTIKVGGVDCCPQGYICSNGHCCLVGEIWCASPKVGEERCMKKEEFVKECNWCVERSEKMYCTLLPGTCKSIWKEEYFGVYCSPPIREVVEDCIVKYDYPNERFKCLVNYAYKNFYHYYDETCVCLGSYEKTPQDYLNCFMGKGKIKECIMGCGECIEMAATLYSMLVTCGDVCGVNVNDIYLVGGQVEMGRLHAWILYNHPTYGWVFLDPTNPTLTDRLDGMFEYPENYPCEFISEPIVNLNGDSSLPFSNRRCSLNYEVGSPCV